MKHTFTFSMSLPSILQQQKNPNQYVYISFFMNDLSHCYKVSTCLKNAPIEKIENEHYPSVTSSPFDKHTMNIQSLVLCCKMPCLAKLVYRHYSILSHSLHSYCYMSHVTLMTTHVENLFDSCLPHVLKHGRTHSP